ncbi:hypothetical protein PVAP13_9KG440600 [Panicum virgatum]|uniref:Uncharacterized protein n=1 Tax=Panicum virgatum TaxID=38727 RepID=A0A8T0NRB9_PANVG|nr:hypothetical protein PVAP13_9KG440600 [Panicum virgatum]
MACIRTAYLLHHISIPAVPLISYLWVIFSVASLATTPIGSTADYRHLPPFLPRFHSPALCFGLHACAASTVVPSWGIIVRDHYCSLVMRIDSNESHAKRMCYNRVKAAARQDRLCRAPFGMPVFSFPKEYIDVLKARYSERSYYGGPDYVCQYCLVVFWYHERIQNQSTYYGGSRLIGDDTEWPFLFDKAIAWASAYQLRNLFMTVLVYRDVSNVRALFDQYWKYMADDIGYRLRIALNNLSYIVPDSVLQSGLMKELNDMFSNNGLFHIIL